MEKDYELVLKALGENTSTTNELLKILDSELSLPNIPTPTLGGEVFWNNIAEYGGWKLQQNMITHHARILNSDNVRIAWGTINGMIKAMDRMAAQLHKYEKKKKETSGDRITLMEELKKLKELLDIGAITQREYDEKKKRIMDQL
ncbi:MAG TPA: SHOCT domain-containing protein [Candidatus Lachnoclostridium pullistercoris]|uniref:SHOCT domain-containing protein n=1 Tax=Candidatus Lachnoclostridium pullistercoris TaxID=2838632 RepID=A0A9D2T683_9FIRM|nr:SHOCT domain-containing protein [Candidatus Lachnoclostridium pullistercoris]